MADTLPLVGGLDDRSGRKTFELIVLVYHLLHPATFVELYIYMYYFKVRVMYTCENLLKPSFR